MTNSLSAGVIYTVPNDARSRIMNDADIKGSIALIDRGEVRKTSVEPYKSK